MESYNWKQEEAMRMINNYNENTQNEKLDTNNNLFLDLWSIHLSENHVKENNNVQNIMQWSKRELQELQDRIEQIEKLNYYKKIHEEDILKIQNDKEIDALANMIICGKNKEQKEELNVIMHTLAMSDNNDINEKDVYVMQLKDEKMAHEMKLEEEELSSILGFKNELDINSFSETCSDSGTNSSTSNTSTPNTSRSNTTTSNTSTSNTSTSNTSTSNYSISNSTNSIITNTITNLNPPNSSESKHDSSSNQTINQSMIEDEEMAFALQVAQYMEDEEKKEQLFTKPHNQPHNQQSNEQSTLNRIKALKIIASQEGTDLSLEQRNAIADAAYQMEYNN